MSIVIDKYTIKRLVKFAYDLKQDLNWVVIRVWEELIREEKRHMTDGQRKEYLAEYRKYYPFIEEQCILLENERRKKAILSDITAETAKAMIRELAEQGIADLPESYTVRGTDIGRVAVYFQSPSCTINAPLDHLRARLIRRFPNKKRQQL